MSNLTPKPRNLIIPVGVYRTRPQEDKLLTETRDEARIFVGEGPAPNPDIRGWGLPEIADHVRGRGETTAQVMIGVAVLKQLRLLWTGSAVGYTKAVWQDWRGTRERPRAHQFPCNPTIGGYDIPRIPKSSQLQAALIAPLARTDFLPFEVNYADRRFEELGGIRAAAEAVRFVVRHQDEGRAVDSEVIYHAVINIALAGYQQAYDALRIEIRDKINRESLEEMMARDAAFKTKSFSPTLGLEGLEDLLSFLDHYNRRVQPRLLLRQRMKAEAERLLALNRE